MSTTNSPERRGEPRITVDLWVDERTDEALYLQRATNLSVGGLYLERTLPHPPGTRVTLELKLPGTDAQLRITGEVVAAAERELGMGIKFVDLTDDERTLIADYLARCNEEAPDGTP